MTMGDTGVTCVCGSITLPTFVRRDGTGAIVGCWIALETDGRARPGCQPDERANEIIPRRNARLEAIALLPPPERPTYPGGVKIHCACGRTAFALTTNINEIGEPPVDPDPLDPTLMVMATTCWLAIAEDGGPQEGCSPDARTWDVLCRARGVAPPQSEVTLEALAAPRPSDEARLEFLELRASVGRHSKAKPVEPEPPPADPEGPELSLFG